MSIENCFLVWKLLQVVDLKQKKEKKILGKNKRNWLFRPADKIKELNSKHDLSEFL